MKLKMLTFYNFKTDNNCFLTKWRQKAENGKIVSSEKKKKVVHFVCALILRHPSWHMHINGEKGIEIKASSKMCFYQLCFTLLYHDNIKLKINQNC